jgi:hypothetical protein
LFYLSLILFFKGNIRSVLGDCINGESRITIGGEYIGMDDLRLIVGGYYSDMIKPATPVVIELDLEERPRPSPTIKRIRERKIKWTPYMPKSEGVSKRNARK